MIRQHRARHSDRGLGGNAAVWLIVALAVMASGCGEAPARSGSEASDRGTTTSPSDSAPAQVRARSSVWIDTLQMVSTTTGWALLWPSNPNAGSALAVARTADDGRTWSDVTPPAAVSALTGGQALLKAATAQQAWLAVTADKGGVPATTHVFNTTDGGRSWRESSAVGGAASPVAIDFAGPRRGWLLDSLGEAMNQNPVTLYRSTDGGVRWSLAAKSPRMAGDLATNSGLPVGCDKDGVVFESALDGWITSFCPVGSTVLASTDGGAHWTPASLPAVAGACQNGCEILPPEFYGSSVFLVAGSYPANAYLLVSTDHGHTWRAAQMPSGAGSYPRVTFFSARDGIAVSASSQGRIGRTFFVTTDGGLSWSAIRQGVRFRGNWDDFDFVTVCDGFSWTYPGADLSAAPLRLYRTSDCGRTWASFVPRLS
jgi:photosystem II stability/assembly factor-like uncharacterized protein